MTVSELAAVILLVCGSGTSEKTLDCRDFMVNCAVGKAGEIEAEKVEECTKEPDKKYTSRW